MDLYQIQLEVQSRVERTVEAKPDWPCRKGCDECCRRLATVPQVSAAEWQQIAAALESRSDLKQRIADSAASRRPITCPLLDTATGSCLVYEARPIACRTYGFYAEREYVLGCSQIEAIAATDHPVVWGNHEGIAQRLQSLGPAYPLYHWLQLR